MPGGKIHLTPEQLDGWNEVHDLFPGWKREVELIAEYALDRGGLVLRFWQLKLGPAFGESDIWTIPRCAEELAVPVSRLQAIHWETRAWVAPRLAADPDWQRLQSDRELKSPVELLEEAKARRRRG